MLQASKVENKTHKVNDKLHKKIYFYFVNKSKSMWGQLSSMYTITLTNSVLWRVTFFGMNFCYLVKKFDKSLQTCFYQGTNVFLSGKNMPLSYIKTFLKNTLTTVKYFNILWKATYLMTTSCSIRQLQKKVWGVRP